MKKHYWRFGLHEKEGMFDAVQVQFTDHKGLWKTRNQYPVTNNRVNIGILIDISDMAQTMGYIQDKVVYLNDEEVW